MAIIKIKYKSTSGSTPTGLTAGELAINLSDRQMWVGGATGNIIKLVGLSDNTFTGQNTFNDTVYFNSNIVVDLIYGSSYPTIAFPNSGLEVEGASFSSFLAGISTSGITVTGQINNDFIVKSVNGLTGRIGLSAGVGITFPMTPSGNTFDIKLNYLFGGNTMPVKKLSLDDWIAFQQNGTPNDMCLVRFSSLVQQVNNGVLTNATGIDTPVSSIEGDTPPTNFLVFQGYTSGTVGTTSGYTSYSTVKTNILNGAVTSFNGRTGAVQGVSAAVAGNGISVSGATGAVTITNTGVTRAVAGTGISVTANTGTVSISNTGVLTFNGNAGAVTGASLGANTFTGLQTSATGFSGPLTGNATTATNSTQLVGVAGASYARTDISNTFLGTQVFNAGISLNTVGLVSSQTLTVTSSTSGITNAGFLYVGSGATFASSVAANTVTNTTAGTTFTLSTRANGSTASNINIVPVGSVFVAPAAVSGIGGDTPKVVVQNSDNASGQVQISGGNLYLGTKTNTSAVSTPSNLVFGNPTTAFTTTITAPNTASSNKTITLPNATGTVILDGSANTFSALQTFTGGISASAGITLNSPSLTGTPVSTTAAVGTNTTQIATTAFVQNEIIADTVTSFNGRTGSVQGVSAAVAGDGISVSGATGAVTITNAGVTRAVAGTGISVTANTGTVSISNTGVLSFNGNAGAVQGVSAAVAGTGISVSGATGAVTITNIGVQSFNGSTGAISGVGSIVAGTNVTISPTGGTGAVTINATQPTVNNGTLTMNTSGNGISGTQTFTANQSSAATFTVTSNATNANTGSTIVFRDASGNFSAGTITAALTGTASNASSLGNTAAASWALLNSPTFTGTPSAPTATSGTNTTQIATTAFVRTEVSNLVASAPAALDTLNELATALGNDPNFSTTITTALGNKAGTTGGNASGTWGISITGNAATATNSTQLGGTAAASWALLNSPTLTGTPAAPTAAVGTNTTQIATTAFVQNEIVADTVTSFNGRTGAVQGVSAAVAGDGISVSGATGAVTITNAGVTRAVAGTGISVTANTGTVSISNTGVLTFNGNAGTVTGASLGANTFTGLQTSATGFSGPLTGNATSATTATTATNSTQLGGVAAASYALLASPTFTGTPAAPTAATGTNTTQVATTAFVLNNSVARLNGLTGGITLNGSSGISITSSVAGGITISGSGFADANSVVSSFNGRTGSVQGVSAAVAGTGISVSGATGAVTITNNGVQSFNGLTGALTGVGSIVAGTNITISPTGGTGAVTINATQPTVNNGTLTLGVSGNGISGTQTFTANQSSNATFTVTSNATNANTGSTIVFRDASGNFSAGTITAALTGTASNASALGNTAASGWAQLGSANTFTGLQTSATGFSGPLTGAVTGNATTATTLQTARGFSLSGDVTAAAVNFNGSAAVTLATTIANNAVTTTKIADANVTNAKLANSTISGVALGGTLSTLTIGTGLGGGSYNGGSAVTITNNGVQSFNGLTGAISGVGSIVAGTNITISPTGGTGAVTINATQPTVNNGTLTLGVSGNGIAGSQTFTANQAGNATFTVTSNATDVNTASTIVFRNASGNFSAGTITAALTGTASNASALGNTAASGWAQLTANTFTGKQTFNLGIEVSNGATFSTPVNVAHNITQTGPTRGISAEGFLYVGLGATFGTSVATNRIVNRTAGATLTVATTTSGNVDIIPVGNVFVAPTPSAGSGGDSPKITVQGTDNAAGQVRISGGDLYLGSKTNALSSSSSVNLILGNPTNAFTTTLTAPNTATSSKTITLPNTTGTVALDAAANTFTALQTFSSGISASGGVTFNTPIVSTRLSQTSSAVFDTKTADFSPSNADNGKVFVINISGKTTITVTLEGLSTGWRAKFLVLGGTGVSFISTTGTVLGTYGVDGGGVSALTEMVEVYCYGSGQYFAA